MRARLDLYKTYYPDHNPKPDPKPNPKPHFGTVVWSSSAMPPQTDIPEVVLLTVHCSTIFRRFFNSVWHRFLCRILSSGISHIKLAMRLLLKQFNKGSNRCANSKHVICHQQRRHMHSRAVMHMHRKTVSAIVPQLLYRL